MDSYVRKPFRISEIYDSLRQDLGVKFIYRNEEPVAETATGLLSVQKMAAMVPALRNGLRDALESLESERIASAIERIGVVDNELSRTLSRLADEFDYPSILDALERS